MAGLDNIPQKQNVEIEIVKLDESTINTVIELNNNISTVVNRFGEIYIRRNELNEELKKLDELQLQFDFEFKAKNEELLEFLDVLDEKYPQGRINLQEGTIQYQPGAPSRKQQKMQASQPSSQGMKVVKE
jgi:hypothetical protein